METVAVKVTAPPYVDGELEVATVIVGVSAFNCKANVFATLPAFAVSATAWAVATDETVAVNPALVAFAGTVKVAGTVTAVLMLDRLTLSPPLGAAAVSVTVQPSVPAPVMDPLLHDSALKTGTGTAMVSVSVALPVPALLVALSVIVEVPAAVGVPEIKPEAVFTVRPAGSPVAP